MTDPMASKPDNVWPPGAPSFSRNVSRVRVRRVAPIR